ncbi:hypothetical protein BOVATA_022210 [Babesia ovata]|uniref:Uncharacterized protein n=1 Tax=Babesia ovata TaxID=189622 RepID=A0A2H6KCK6_9APIC|nr:uncharacterized protein BOVATA_022210 [Babesia ovata]GBE60728.1 hypothetical protein BOVATA_022210 [Babesia ovata]
MITFLHEVHNIINNGGQRLLLSADLLANQNHVRVRLHTALQSEMGRRTAHDANEVVRVLGAAGVSAQVANELGVRARSGVEPKAHLYVVRLHVTVHCFGDANNATGLAKHRVAIRDVRRLAPRKVVGKQSSVAVGTITTNNDQTVQIQIVHSLNGAVKVSHTGNLATTGQQHVETTHVSELLHQIITNDLVLAIEEPVQTTVETYQLGLRVAQGRDRR